MIRSAVFSTVCAAIITICAIAKAAEYQPLVIGAGTQTFVPGYQFEGPGKTKLVETAERIHELGSDVIKFEMSSRVGTTYGTSTAGISNLTQLAQNQPSYSQVFQMPFRTFMVWMFPFSVNSLNNHYRDGYSTAEKTDEYNEIYNLVVYLRTQFNGTRKSFYLGHWEGDHAIKGSTNFAVNASATDVARAIEWLNNRQKAVNDARAATSGSNVEVYHYAEVNIVIDDIYNPSRNSMTGEVLPNLDPATRIDAVSYSSYDSTSVPMGSPAFPGEFNNALNHIKNTLSGKTSGLLPDYVFVGEHGYPTTTFSAADQATRSRDVIKNAVNFGSPFVLYWQMYDNEGAGLWMINSSNVKQPVWYEHNSYLGKAHTVKNLYRFWLNRNPDTVGYRSFSNSYDTFQPAAMMDSILNSAEYASMKTNTQYVSFLMQNILGDANHPESSTYIAQLSTQSRAQVLNNVLNSSTFASLITNTKFVQYLFLHTLQRNNIDTTSAEFQAVLTQLNSGTPRATLWRTFLNSYNSNEFMLKELDLRARDTVGDSVVGNKFFIAMQSAADAKQWAIYD